MRGNGTQRTYFMGNILGLWSAEGLTLWDYQMWTILGFWNLVLKYFTHYVINRVSRDLHHGHKQIRTILRFCLMSAFHHLL